MLRIFGFMYNSLYYCGRKDAYYSLKIDGVCY